jgi:signal transduction histidine kinase
MSRIVRLYILILTMLMANLSPCWAADQVLGSSFFVDDSGVKDLQQASEVASWSPYSNVLALGFVAKPVWIKVELPQDLQEQELRLRIRPSYLDQVKIYLPQKAGGYVERVTGDRMPYASRENSDTALSVSWRAFAHAPPIYLQIKTTSTMKVFIELFDFEEAANKRDIEHTFFGIYLGVMLMLMLWSFWLVWQVRDVIVFWFACYQFVLLQMALGLLGYSARYSPMDAQLTDMLTSLMVLLASVTGSLFHWYFLRDNGLTKIGHDLFKILLAISVTNVVLLFTVDPQIPLQINSFTVLLAGVVLFPIVWSLQRHQDKFGKQILWSYVVLAALVIVSLLPNLGFFHVGEWSMYVTLIHGILSAMVLSVLLHQRNRMRYQSAQQTREDLIEARALTQAAIAEREEKEKFLTMLTHELRTPLSVIRMVLSHLTPNPAAHDAKPLQFGLRAVNDINDVIDRCIRVDQVDHQKFAVAFEATDVREVVRNLSAQHLLGERLQVTLADEVRLIHTDPALFKVVLTNLLDNALKYSAMNSVVHWETQLMTKQGQSCVVFCFRNVVGAAGKPDPSQLFSKYYRSPGAHQKTGSGLGLYLSKALARHLGGDLHYRSDAVDEVCFEFCLPV